MIPLGPSGRRGPAQGLRTVRPVVIAVVAGSALLLIGLLTIPMMVVGGSSMLYSAGGTCSGGQSGTGQSSTTTTASKTATNSIPADYLSWFQRVGQQYGVPCVILAGISKVESGADIWVIPANEELIVARQTVSVLTTN